MSCNPHAASKTDLAKNVAGGPIYSPSQVAAGALIGGPVGLIYFVRNNFLTPGETEHAKKPLLRGGALIVVLLVISPTLPEKLLSIAFSIGNMFAGQQIANTRQLTKKAIDESTRYTTQSNWRILGSGMLCLLGSMIALFVPIMLRGMVGVSFDG